MNINQDSRFGLNPTNIDISRSKFNRPSEVLTTFNTGDIIPFYVDEVLPGDTFQVKTSKVVRMQTLITPMFGNIWLDTMYFFVPNRLVWSHWKNFMGESENAWIPQNTYSVPQLTSPSSTGWTKGTIADYMGIPTGVTGLSVNALPFRAYALICNEWFRNTNVSDPLVVPVTDSTVAGVNTGNFTSDVAKGGLPYKANKIMDYFVGGLPAPQRGPDVLLPSSTTNLPVYTMSDLVPEPSTAEWLYMNKVPRATGVPGSGSWDKSQALYIDASGTTAKVGSTETASTYRLVPENLWAVQNGSLASVNALRLAFQLQKAYEKDARGGDRYRSIILSHFGIQSPDARQQVPEYLGGNRVAINVSQVTQQSQTATTPQGTPTGVSTTVDKNHDFVKSFTEHGFVIGVMVARYNHVYQQGLERFWSRKSRFDYYWPVLANIGEQAIKNKEIYAQGSSVINASTGIAYDEEVFAYQEAWGDYRYKPSRTSAEMRSQYATSLDVWHLGDDYNALPSMSESWTMEDKAPVDRVLAVQSNISDQFFADILISNEATRPMPLYSIPGLIDHH